MKQDNTFIIATLIGLSLFTIGVIIVTVMLAGIIIDLVSTIN